MQKSNVNPCPHKNKHAHIIRTSDGRSAMLCQECLDEMEKLLADKVFISGMLRSVMTGNELSKIHHELENIALKIELSR